MLNDQWFRRTRLDSSHCPHIGNLKKILWEVTELQAKKEIEFSAGPFWRNECVCVIASIELANKSVGRDNCGFFKVIGTE